jgi:hypothetical protein
LESHCRRERLIAKTQIQDGGRDARFLSCVPIRGQCFSAKAAFKHSWSDSFLLILMNNGSKRAFSLLSLCLLTLSVVYGNQCYTAPLLFKTRIVISIFKNSERAFFCCLFVFVGLGFELRASHLQSRLSTT